MVDATGMGGGSHLSKIHRNQNRLGVLEDLVFDKPGETTLHSAADLPAAVGGVHTLNENWTYRIAGPIDLVSNTLEGINVVIIGDTSFQTLISTDSINPLFSSNGTGFINFQNCIFSNVSGPIVDLDVGLTANSTIVITQNSFLGTDFITSGGSIGTITNAERVTLDTSFGFGLSNGLVLAGQINELSVTNTTMESDVGAANFTGFEVADTATLNLAVFSILRFNTSNVADYAMKFGTGATYSEAARIQSCAVRGVGMFLDPAGHPKSDVHLIFAGNIGVLDSVFAASVGFNANTSPTTFAVTGVPVRIGNGTPGHTLFNGGGFIERFSLSGAETQLQELTYDGIVARTFHITVSAELDRGGGGNLLSTISVQLNNVTIPDSATTVEVGNSASTIFVETDAVMSPGDDLQLIISNDTSTTSIIVNSCKWVVSAA